MITLSRPVTDCSGISLEIGAAQIPTLGEITFFARALSVVEQEEIMFAGFTLHGISAGKLPFVPVETEFDRTNSKSSSSFSAASGERADATKELAIESSLSRQVMAMAPLCFERCCQPC